MPYFGDPDRYAPSAVPQSFDQRLLDFIQFEFQRIHTALLAGHQLNNQRHKEPPHPTEGMLAYAPGSPGWDPGGGQGFYGFTGGTWTKLHA